MHNTTQAEQAARLQEQVTELEARYRRVQGELVSLQQAADRMANAIDAAVAAKQLSSRSPAADAMLDYRDPSVAPEMEELTRLTAEVSRLQAWVNDLQSGMYVNCVYCGHRYGPGETTPVSMADALKSHIEACPRHPLAEERRRHAVTKRLLEQTQATLAALRQQLSGQVGAS